MNAIAEIDEAGRFVVPETLREDLHLVPGTRLVLNKTATGFVAEPESRPRGLYMDRGTLVYDAGSVASADVVQWIDQDREDRTMAVLGREVK